MTFVKAVIFILFAAESGLKEDQCLALASVLYPAVAPPVSCSVTSLQLDRWHCGPGEEGTEHL